MHSKVNWYGGCWELLIIPNYLLGRYVIISYKLSIFQTYDKGNLRKYRPRTEHVLGIFIFALIGKGWAKERFSDYHHISYEKSL